ncbi:MAG: nuclear transport factor 2 family protein [Cellvibrionaceae bacterium]|nr:nuclear transport factor 2 family protein [Cellvibrionaceae bacterium]MCV6626508.1 nuclear transport factor 2 family protein [Cellvibrionaceae bacterium]
MADPRLQQWHKAVFEQDQDTLRELLHPEVEFYSPAFWKPKSGQDIAFFILTTVIDIFEDFTYHREWIDGNEMALEFSAGVNGKSVKGIDLIRWNDAGQITHFEVMVRPLNGLAQLAEQIGERFKQAGLL